MILPKSKFVLIYYLKLQLMEILQKTFIKNVILGVQLLLLFKVKMEGDLVDIVLFHGIKQEMGGAMKE